MAPHLPKDIPLEPGPEPVVDMQADFHAGMEVSRSRSGQGLRGALACKVTKREWAQASGFHPPSQPCGVDGRVGGAKIWARGGML